MMRSVSVDPHTSRMKSEYDHAKQVWESGRTCYTRTLDPSSQAPRYLNTPSPGGGDDVDGVVQSIESVRWVLFSTSHAFRPEREESHMPTDSANISGRLIGVYTFRRNESS